MSANELSDEIRAGVRFYGWFKNSFLLGIAGIQNVGSIDLIRPLLRVYCLPETRLGSALLQHLLSLAQTSTILVGTWEDARQYSFISNTNSRWFRGRRKTCPCKSTGTILAANRDIGCT